MSSMKDLFIFNKTNKAVARRVLSSPLIVKNPVYQHYYQNRIDKVMDECLARPQRVRLENTNICHDKCGFCPHRTMKRKKGVMTMKLFRNLAKQTKEWGVPELVIQGFGEPLKDLYFFERVAYAKKLDVSNIQSNISSIALSKRLSRYLVNSGLTELFISCNEASEDKVKYLLSLPRPADMRICLSFIHGYTVPYKNIKNAEVSVSYPHTWGGKLGQEPYGIKDPCRLLWVTMYVNWEGHVHLCCMDYECEYIIADANKKKLEDIWKNNSAFYQCVHAGEGWDGLPICRECGYNAHNKSPWWV